MISVIIPTLNEGRTIESVLARTQSQWVKEVIVVDGGSTDDTVSKARARGARVIETDRGRARQMNLGAQQAGGEILLFLHGDSLLPLNFATEVRTHLSRTDVVAGAFRLAIEGRSLSYRIIEMGANCRSILFQMPYGDQGLFLPVSLFHDLGGFSPIPFMEDFDMMLRLRRRGRIAICRSSMFTSSRRWREFGPWRTTLRNQFLVVGFLLGVPPSRLGQWYQAR